ncbi:RNA methyltransferase [Xenophilus sp. AP218F]|nr:RNA methyltransferase [Xenophilus sp. AP218F]
MSSFRSRQRAQVRRDSTSRDTAPSSPAGGDSASPAGKTPIIQKKASDPNGPRAPYSGQRPGEGKPDWGQRKPPEQRFERDGERKPFSRDGQHGDRPRFERDGERKPFQRDGERKPFSRDGQHGDRLRFERDGERKPFPRDGERKPFSRDGQHGDRPRFERDGERDNRYSRDRGPSGRKPLNQPETQEGDAPRKLFGKPSAERDNRFRRDEGVQLPGHDDIGKRYSRDRGPSGRKPLHTAEGEHAKPAQAGERKPRRDYGDEAQPDQPRKLFNKPAGERDNRFRRDEERDAPRQWQERAQRDSRPDESERAPRKLFSKPAERRDDYEPRRPSSLHPLGNDHRLDAGDRRAPQEHRRGESPRGNWQQAERPQGGELGSPQLTTVHDSRLALFAPCPRGLEAVLTDELAALGASDIVAGDGGVAFAGDAQLMMAANLHCRTASRVLLRLAHGGYRHEQDIYRLALNVDWPRWFNVSKTIKLKADGIGAQVKSLDYIGLVVKDAICDRFRQAQLGRPSVDTRQPDVRVNVFLTADTATVYLDTSGEPLFKRGWREETGEAPLRENLAAGILLLAGYDGSQPLIDPMCGSGTFLVEAADIALKRAPGRNRAFGFQQLRNFDATGWEAMQLAARQQERAELNAGISGSDRAQAMINVCRANLERAGLAGKVSVTAQDVLDARPTAESGILVANPPYGVRMDELEQLGEWYPQLGDWLKAHFAGWMAYFFTGDLRLAKLIRLSPKRRTPLYNGSLQCRLFAINMVEGSARKEKPAAAEDDAGHDAL